MRHEEARELDAVRRRDLLELHAAHAVDGPDDARRAADLAEVRQGDDEAHERAAAHRDVAGLEGQAAEADVAREELALVADGRAVVLQRGDRGEQRDVDAGRATALLGDGGGRGRAGALAEAHLVAVAVHAPAQHHEAAAVGEDDVGARAGGRQELGLDGAQRLQHGLAAAERGDAAVHRRVADRQADDLICNETLHGVTRSIVAGRAI